jgi:PA14 domain
MDVAMTQKIIYTIIISAITISLFGQQPCVGTAGQITWQQYRGLYDDEINELLSWPDFPDHPYETKTLYNTKSVVNYDNAMGAMMRGYIYVPTSDSVTFNLTGNEQARFYLSTDENPANKVLRAYLNVNTGAEEYTKYPTQTSIKLYLQAGVNYYFEILYVDGTGSDYANLYWKAPFVDINNWKPITAGFLKNIGCPPSVCPPQGTPCNDGNASTTDDIEDGNCNCFGKLPTTNTCIGERSVIENYRYDNIAGSELNDLYINPAYPAMPSFSEVLPMFGKAITTNTNHGRLTQAFLQVPVSGLYKFNVTGDDQTVLYLSSDESPANKQAHQCLVSGFTGATQYDKYQWQSTSFIYLDASKYYYIELNGKQSSGSAHFGVFWQTPYGTPGIWKRIASAYLYNYDCTLACMPQGAVCDDGNIFTNNDVYDGNCTCAGTPCVGAGCNNPLASYVPYEKCNVTDLVDNREDNNWLSCSISPNPNPARDTSHWIKYDLGEKHRLLTSHIWNYNVANKTIFGMQNVAIDYSEDGVTWSNFGTYNWALATGEGGYGGFVGPDFQSLTARYVLITSLDAGNNCRGLSKVSFKAVYCPDMGTPCNDKNPLTIDDKYNEQCECMGVPMAENLCVNTIVVLGDSLLHPTNYSAVMHVQSMSQVAANQTTSFIGGDYIELNPGFSSEDGAIFLAAIDTCNSTTANGARIASRMAARQIIKADDVPIKWLTVNQTGKSDEVTIGYYLDRPGDVRIEILDATLKPIYNLADHNYINKGHYTKVFRSKKLSAGLYTVAYTTEGKSYYEKMKIN